jgi:hypothetical protein
MKGIPIDIWLKAELKALSPEQQNRCRDAIYRYIELKRKRFSTTARGLQMRLGISGATESSAIWTFRRSGTVDKGRPESFKELRTLLA